MTSDLQLPQLPLARYRLEFRLQSPPPPHRFLGSAWRGVLGHALKKLVCVTQCKTCTECLLYRSCVYPYIFETPPSPEAEKLRKYAAAPHPFCLTLPHPQEIVNGVYPLGLTLFGRANSCLAYLIHAIRNAASHGLRGWDSLDLLTVKQQAPLPEGEWKPVLHGAHSLSPLPPQVPRTPPLPPAIQIHFLTPLRLRHGETYVVPERFRFADLFGNLLRRVSLLTYFHTDTPLDTDFRGLTVRAHRIEFREKNLRWVDWTRYSSRQNTLLEMGGLVGHVTLSTEDLAEFWPYLWLAQFIHAGKGTSMGLGRCLLRGAAPSHSPSGKLAGCSPDDTLFYIKEGCSDDGPSAG